MSSPDPYGFGGDGMNPSRPSATALQLNDGFTEICAPEDDARFLAYRVRTEALCADFTSKGSERSHLKVLSTDLAIAESVLDQELADGDYPTEGRRLTDLDLARVLLTGGPSVKEKFRRWPADFQSNGCIRPGRLPCGPPPLFVWRGVAWLLVFDRYYILGGDGYTNWLLQPRPLLKESLLWVGLVAATAVQVNTGIAIRPNAPYIDKLPVHPKFTGGGWVLLGATLTDISSLTTYRSDLDATALAVAPMIIEGAKVSTEPGKEYSAKLSSSSWFTHSRISPQVDTARLPNYTISEVQIDLSLLIHPPPGHQPASHIPPPADPLASAGPSDGKGKRREVAPPSDADVSDSYYSAPTPPVKGPPPLTDILLSIADPDKRAFFARLRFVCRRLRQLIADSKSGSLPLDAMLSANAEFASVAELAREAASSIESMDHNDPDFAVCKAVYDQAASAL